MAGDTVRVLLIDDEAFARQLYSDGLAEAGWVVDCAASAEEAQTLFAPGRYQVVVTDLLLPGRDGLELLAEVKQRDPGCEVVVITGLERVEPAVRALRSGASDYLVKPVAPETLRMAVSRAVAMRRIVQENAALKASLALYEAGRRVAAAADRDHLGEAVLRALLGLAPASAGLLLAPGKDAAGRREWNVLRSSSLPADVVPAAVERIRAGPLAALEQAAAAGNTAPLLLPDAPAAMDGLSAATLVPLADAGRLLGVAVLWGERPPGAAALTELEFLARNAAVTLALLERLDDAARLALVDDLTGLYNARHLDWVLDRRTAPDAPPQRFAVLFLDLDHFKQVNDTHGHLAGSRLLVEIGAVIRGCVRDDDVCVRYGGDEFCVVLSTGDKEVALRIAERIRVAIGRHRFRVEGGAELSVTASIGVACFPDHAHDKRSLLDLADRAMYRGKRASRNVTYLAGEAA